MFFVLSQRAPSLQKDIELEIKQLQADRNRHFAALQAAEVSRGELLKAC